MTSPSINDSYFIMECHRNAASPNFSFDDSALHQQYLADSIPEDADILLIDNSGRGEDISLQCVGFHPMPFALDPFKEAIQSTNVCSIQFNRAATNVIDVTSGWHVMSSKKRVPIFDEASSSKNYEVSEGKTLEVRGMSLCPDTFNSLNDDERLMICSQSPTTELNRKFILHESIAESVANDLAKLDITFPLSGYKLYPVAEWHSNLVFSDSDLQ